MPQSEGSIISHRYRLVRKIGEGGMASVWEAEHVALGSRIAVKFLHRTAPKGSETADRFLREARVAAQVKHRNVVDIIDFGFTDDDVPYMVMEKLIGKPLSDHLLLHGQLDFDEAARLVSLTLRGLSAVHDAGIVHRDLKPDNIFLVHDEDGPFPKLLDFGLSRRAGQSNMTLEGALLGTPDYMSPEQARGLNDLDARTDIYSMGVILYEMVSGKMPHESEHIGELIAMIARDPPIPVRQRRPDIPDELAVVIERATAKDRDQRFPNARAMREALVELYSAYADGGSGLQNLSENPLEPSSVARLSNLERKRSHSALRGQRTKSGNLVIPRSNSQPIPIPISESLPLSPFDPPPPGGGQEITQPEFPIPPALSSTSGANPPQASRAMFAIASLFALSGGALLVWMWIPSTAPTTTFSRTSAVLVDAPEAQVDAGVSQRSDASIVALPRPVQANAPQEGSESEGTSAEASEAEDAGRETRATKRRGARQARKRPAHRR